VGSTEHGVVGRLEVRSRRLLHSDIFRLVNSYQVWLVTARAESVALRIKLFLFALDLTESDVSVIARGSLVHHGEGEPPQGLWSLVSQQVTSDSRWVFVAALDVGYLLVARLGVGVGVDHVLGLAVDDGVRLLVLFVRGELVPQAEGDFALQDQVV